MTIIIAKAVLFLLLTYALGCFFYLMGKNKVIENGVKDIYARMDATSHKNIRERKKNIGRWEPQNSLEKLLEKPRKRLQYSGLQYRFLGLTIEIWQVLKLLTAAAVYFLSFLLSGRFKVALPVTVIYILLLYVAENILMVFNYNRVENSMIEFLNMTSNYLETSGEITEAFGKVAKYMPEPLKSALIDCSYEARTSGNSRLALLTLADRIEHPVFKDVIQNIEMGMQYTANYKDIITNCRKYVLDERREQKERAMMIHEAFTTMTVTAVGAILILVIMERFLQISITNTFASPYGRIGLIVSGCSYVYIIWHIFTDRQVK